MDNPELFSEPGSNAVDYRIGRDDSAGKGWRRDTPPAGEDGSVPDRRLTIGTIIYPNVPADGGGVYLPPLSSFDLDM